jgi:pimeloyl-ACP methyl ester carboxylesterase
MSAIVRYPVHFASPRGFRQAFHHERSREGRTAMVCVHGWPETKRLYHRVIAPLRDAGFDIVVPDLRAFGDSETGPDGFNDVVSHARDVHALVADHLGYDSVVLVGGDLGGSVVQEIALRWPEWVERMVLFNSPLPFLKAEMAGMETRADASTRDYFERQGTDADGLIAELASPDACRNYVAQFYGSRLWAHPGNFSPADVEYHTEPFGDPRRLRETFGNYESVYSADKRVERPLFGPNRETPTLIVFGTSDHVIYPDFDKMARVVFARHSGPVRIDVCGHFVPWEAPERFVELTLEFCRGS